MTAVVVPAGIVIAVLVVLALVVRYANRPVAPSQIPAPPGLP